MPELPEVETLRRQLTGVITDKVILKFEVLDPRIGAIGGLAGKRILSAGRQGKLLFLRLDHDAFLMLHLRMTGRLLWQPEPFTLLPHTRFIMSFAEGRIACIDPRRFATLVSGDTPPCTASSVDPLGEYSAEQLCRLAWNRRLPVKSFLMDQRFIAGIGNIYACEILHAAAKDPYRMACTFSPDEWRSVAQATRSVLRRAVDCRGTTVSDWRDLFGERGAYQHELRAYAREGKPCPRCSHSIRRIRLHGRGTYFCPSCQK